MPDPSEVAMSFVSFCILTIHHIGEYIIPSLLLVLASLWHSLGFLHLCLYPKNITVPHTRHQHGTYHHLLIHSQFLDVRVACHPQCQCQDKSLQHLISSRHLMSHHVWYLFKSVLLFFSSAQCQISALLSPQQKVSLLLSLWSKLANTPCCQVLVDLTVCDQLLFEFTNVGIRILVDSPWQTIS